MFELLFPYTVWCVLTLVLIMGAAGAWVSFRSKLEEVQQREGRLPEATRYGDLDDRLREMEARRDRVGNQIAQAEAAVRRRETAEQRSAEIQRELVGLTTTRDRSLDELAALRGQAAELKIQLAEGKAVSAQYQQSKQDLARQQEVGREHTQVLTQLEARCLRQTEQVAQLDEWIKEKQQSAAELEGRCESLNRQRASLGSEVSQLQELRAQYRQLQKTHADLSQQQQVTAAQIREGELQDQRLRAEAEKLQQEIAAQREHVETLRNEQENLLARRAALQMQSSELEELAKQEAVLKQSVEVLNEKHARLKEAVIETETKNTRLRAELADLETKRDEARQALEETRETAKREGDKHHQCHAELITLQHQMVARRQENEDQAHQEKAARECLQAAQGKLDDTRLRLAEVQEQVAGLSAQRAQLEQTVQVLQDGLHEMRLQAGYRGSHAKPLAELWQPVLTAAEFSRPREDAEMECLARTQAYFSQLGLQFSERVLHAFHTSLKVAEVSPLLVLTGLSGTGKSELVRRYTEGMGMHFLRISVSPRWDDFQDLFGFFNYLDYQYRAPELTRALMQMDPCGRAANPAWEPPEDWDTSLADRMLLILMEEMDLARPELYLNDFLKRLEMRRGIDKSSPEQRRLAEVLLDVGGPRANESGLRLFVDTNVLLAGTMNQETSVSALTDKVLDRANVLSFGRPAGLAGARSPRSVSRPDSYLPHAQWRQWINSESALPEAMGRQVDSWVEELNGAMELLGKSFAYRTHLAIRAYVANYPVSDERRLPLAMADQVEQRILPRFAGCDPHERAVTAAMDKVLRLVDQWGDTALTDAIDRCRQEGQRDYFLLYRGVDRSLPGPTMLVPENPSIDNRPPLHMGTIGDDKRGVSFGGSSPGPSLD